MRCQLDRENNEFSFYDGDSGARGSTAQMKQLAGMRGLWQNQMEKLLKLL